jgi:hypothetical protein
MGELVNLRRARKNRARREREAEAQANRTAHAIPKRDRALADAQRRIEAQRLDAHRRETSDDR